jgi:hypothetical protein
MAATFEWDEANGVGESVSHGVTQVNWKNTDDVATLYSNSPITAGNNSYDKWQYGHFSGTYNQILSGLWAHTAGTLPSGVTLFGAPAMTDDADRLAYATPAVTSNASLTDISTAVAIGSGRAVWFGATGPANSGKAASTTSNPAYTNYLTTQLRTTGAAPPGDIATVTITLQFDEN